MSRRTCSGASCGRRSSSCRGSRCSIRCRPTSERAKRWPARRDGAAPARTFPSAARPSRRSTPFATPAQRRLIFEDFFVFQTGLALRRQQNAEVRKALVPRVDDRIRAVGARGAAVQAHRRPAAGAGARSSPTCRSRGRCSGCCRATSAPARRSSRCWRRWSRWKTAFRWRSWRRPRSSPSSTSRR